MQNALTDEQHIVLYREGDESHMEALINRYLKMIKKKASFMYILGGEEQDLIQEGRIGLMKAVRDYDFGRDASFATFAELCVERQIYNAVTASGRLKNLPLNEYISLTSETYSEDGNSNGCLMDDLRGDPTLEPEGRVISRENVERINNLIDSILTETERDVFILHLTNLSTSRIAAIMGIDPKSADNALQRAKSKLRKALSEG